ncbi:2-amino-4-hydroxy-6-hydroxymethyldihydropteridine diphosphokinase [Helicobacter anatolicus]|uniref:2-amino-4-hydroxy-6- hydroxymethyldihydropteridine diphosphokinase n=1 Tax=Helicobacter anatolicus TaxID=2905874 RepID=UPI001E49EF59|nr:2-amino-4-hydroxy-6-hydroxymethyldihydropteridine diphosphokinase [Helicobacter anatolicus]MCE3040199.1 2-amino-4-hydroxy-6-hydroxymethyldihydropteridine diphosphokinase [Helicobacter anatolicus]
MRALFFTPHFPKHHSIKKIHQNIFCLGIGGNMGDCFRTFKNLVLWFEKNPRFMLISTSPIYQNPAFGFEKQPDFYNATLLIATKESLNFVFHLIFYLERKFKRPRKRPFKNSPRTLDIDLLFFNDKKIKYPHLKLPHPYWNQRESVIIPLLLQNLNYKE